MPFTIRKLLNISLIQKSLEINDRQAIENITQLPGLILKASGRTDCANKVTSYILVCVYIPEWVFSLCNFENNKVRKSLYFHWYTGNCFRLYNCAF